METHQAPLSLGFSRQEQWSGLPSLFQCMTAKSESEVTQLCSTLRDPMDCSLPGSSVHGKSTGVAFHCLLHPLKLVNVSLEILKVEFCVTDY